MNSMLVFFGVGILSEVGMYAGRWPWRNRRVFGSAALLATSFATGALVMWRPDVWSILIAITSLYRLFNNVRVVEGRMHEGYLRRAVWRTGAALLDLQVLLALVWLAWSAWHRTGHDVWSLVTGISLLVAAMLAASVTRRLRRTAWPGHAPHYSDKELPTLTVAIPARNETADLDECLRSVITSDYPKLEVLVLDDCSQTKRTPEIIRAFAHDGVRFVEGQEATETWLPKNNAYNRLLHQASGDYVLFCGVDVRFDPRSMRELVAVMVGKKKDMMSLLPWRAASAERRLALIQGMRYAWELIPPRRLFRRPPVLSTCWIAKKEALERAGGFEAVTRSILPEAHFAREFAKHDTYSFMRGSRALGIESTKPAREQRDTAIRMRYPQLHRRPQNVLLLTLAYAFLLLAPFAVTVLGFWVSVGSVARVNAALASVLLIYTYVRVAVATRTGSWWLALVALPFGVLADIAILHVSMWRYEFSTVEWKGRNICAPAMHVIPHLPKI